MNDKEPERYYDWILWKFRKEKEMEKQLELDFTSKNQTTIKKTVKPKKGRVVMFDGWLWHTAQLPSDETRCVINYNVI